VRPGETSGRLRDHRGGNGTQRCGIGWLDQAQAVDVAQHRTHDDAICDPCASGRAVLRAARVRKSMEEDSFNIVPKPIIIYPFDGARTRGIRTEKDILWTSCDWIDADGDSVSSERIGDGTEVRECR
jgi:hypothetical protein